MLSKLKRVLALFFVLCFISVYACAITAYATVDYHGIQIEEGSYAGIAEGSKKNVEFIWEFFSNKGVTPEMIAGMIGNFLMESSLDDKTLTTDYGDALGMAMWTDDGSCHARTDFLNWCKSKGKDWKKLEVQCEYMWEERTDSVIRRVPISPTGGKYGTGYEMQHDQPAKYEQFWKDAGFADYDTVNTLEDLFKGTYTTPECAGEVFCWFFEGPLVSTSHVVSRMDAAKDVFELCGGKSSSSGTTEKKSKEELAAQGIVLTGEFCAETDFVDIAYLTDTELPLPQYSDLDVGDTFALKDWKEDIENKNEGNEFSVIRAIVVFVGILVVLYSVAIFIAYQFDTNQGFIEIELVSILTLGHLRIAPNEESSTYTPKKEGQRLITQKDVYFITILGIALGILIISGKLYVLIANIIQWITNKWSGT